MIKFDTKAEEQVRKKRNEYAERGKAELITSLMLKENLNDILKERVAEREAIIDGIVEYLGLQNRGLVFYSGRSGKNPILEEIKNYLDNSGDKVKLKKRIAELENENSVLRAVIQGK